MRKKRLSDFEKRLYEQNESGNGDAGNDIAEVEDTGALIRAARDSIIDQYGGDYRSIQDAYDAYIESSGSYSGHLGRARVVVTVNHEFDLKGQALYEAMIETYTRHE